MNPRRRLPCTPHTEPTGLRLYVHQIGGAWAAMVVADDVPAPGPGELNGMAFFATAAEGAERGPKAYLGCSEPGN